MYHSEVIYHVYNQSINYETLYRSDGNYRYFLQKVKRHICPFADIFAYCLMPDHFHLLLKPTSLGCLESPAGRYRRRDEEARSEAAYQQNLSHGFKILLSSYTQAVNREVGRRGSLFKARTKAKPGYHAFYPDPVAPEAELPYTLFIPYLKVCFFYIHDNPTKANLVEYAEEWEFSSALDYAGYRNTGICNFALAEQLLGIKRRTPGAPPSDR